MTTTRADCEALDEADTLAPLRTQFALPPGVIYLDGNSLGALPAATAAHLQQVITAQWGNDLIGSWNRHDWIGAPERVAARIAPLVGAAPNEVLVADTTSINLFKLLAGALSLRPGRRTIVAEDGDFPTDLYILQGLRDLLGDVTLRILPRDQIEAALDDQTAVLSLSQVNYKTGRRWDMATLTAAAHSKGALILWDLCHSAGAMNVNLNASHADLAVGCGYKFLNGGPGAPSFLFVAVRHQPAIRSPLTGWLGHATPFAFSNDYTPANGMRKMLCSSPSILAIAALEAGLAVWDNIDLKTLETKAGGLGDLFIELVEHHCAKYGMQLASPRTAADRGAQVSFAHPEGYALMQALIHRRVIGDFRDPDLIRFGFAPLTTRYTDVHDAVTILEEILRTNAHHEPRYAIRAAVT